ncbi:GrpB family protein [Planococcus sp. FY231025]|uniref:GrpB family protein n=1 Tax=Planococcus sp. FY231025 TaxID=3455699 RepID=UPI003F909E2A
MRKVEVFPFDPDWHRRFKEAAMEIEGIFGEECAEIHHIGSTAVEGLSAKSVIDLLPVVRSIENVDAFNRKMAEAGYVAKGENGLPGRRFFQKGGDERTHHIHVFEKGSREIRRHLAFRDYLRAHPEKAQEYGALKEKLASEYPMDIEKYIAGKTELVSVIEKLAMEES